MSRKSLDEYTTAELIEALSRRSLEATNGPDMTTMELSTQKIKDSFGERHLQNLLDDKSAQEDGKPTACPRCGGRARVESKKQQRTLLTLSGTVLYRRNFYRCSACREGFAPTDDALGIPRDGALTAEMEKRLTDFAINDSFEQAAERFSNHYNFAISENLMRRTIDRVADLQDSLPSEFVQRAVAPSSSAPPNLIQIGLDGTMLPTSEGYREMKLAMVLRSQNHLVGKQGQRGMVTQARYEAAFSVDEITNRLVSAARAEGINQAQRVVAVTDGAPWIKEVLDMHFPNAIQILDWYHAVEHLAECGRLLLGDNHVMLSVWMTTTESMLRTSNTALLVCQLTELLQDHDLNHEPINRLISYISKNEYRMNYKSYREANLPIGSGALESSHKHVLQKRLKLPGQRWSPRRAERMARLRCCYSTGDMNFTTRLRDARGKVIGF